MRHPSRTQAAEPAFAALLGVTFYGKSVSKAKCEPRRPSAREALILFLSALSERNSFATLNPKLEPPLRPFLGKSPPIPEDS